jgi:hypothetical protein
VIQKLVIEEELDHIEERLHRLITAAWERYRLAPTPKSTPDTSIEWRQIRMIRHIRQFGTGKLTKNQLAELRLLLAFVPPSVRGSPQEVAERKVA